MTEQGLAGTWLQRELPGIKVKKIENLSVVESEPSTCCPVCKTMSTNTVWQFNSWVCPICDEHLPMMAVDRLKWFLDQYDFTDQIGKDLKTNDPLSFVDKKSYSQRLQEANLAVQASYQQQNHKKSSDYQGDCEALIALKGQLKDLALVACAFEFKFMGGSMGAVVGDRFVLAGEMALQEKIPLVCFASSGGARMQEGLLSLMQMARTAAVIQRLRKAGVPYLVVLTNPVYGGVTASLAMLGDVHLAEPKAMIGFAGKRVIEQTVREKLQEPFQRAEFLVEHGVIDQVVHRHQLKDTIYRLLTKMMFYQRHQTIRPCSKAD